MKHYFIIMLVLAVLTGSAGCKSSGSGSEQDAPGVAIEPSGRDLARDPPGAAPPPLARPSPSLDVDAATIPGFVIYTREQSIILGLDGLPPVIGAGLWILDERRTPAEVTHALVLSRERARALDLPACACLALEGACEQESVQLRRFDPHTGDLLADQSDHDCSCIHRPDEYGFPPLQGDDGRIFRACKGASEEMIASLVGGQLYVNGWDWNGACYDALSTYEAKSRALVLVSDPPRLTGEGMRLVGCYDFGPAFVARPWPIGHGAHARLERCDENYESEIFLIRRGYLWGIRDDISGAHGTRIIVRRPARPDVCPSLDDPCGDPEAFRALARLEDREREFWIATDGSKALTAVGHEYSLWKRGKGTPIQIDLPGVDSTRDVLGVRAHADISRLRTSIERHASLGTSTPQRAPETVAPSLCHERHEALRAMTGELQAGVVAERSARAWGEDCFARLGIGHWKTAEASCLRGLTVAVDAKTRGALLYNLGRIAEAQGANAQAIARYRDSLSARPGNREVKRRLARLERAMVRSAAER